MVNWGNINWERVFGKIDGHRLYHDGTLRAVRQAIIEREWTETLDDVFDSILWRQETPRELADRTGEKLDVAVRMHDHGYRVLQMMAEKGWIKPTWL